MGLVSQPLTTYAVGWVAPSCLRQEKHTSASMLLLLVCFRLFKRFGERTLVFAGLSAASSKMKTKGNRGICSVHRFSSSVTDEASMINVLCNING